MSSALQQRVVTALIIGIPIILLVLYSDSSRLIFLFLLAILGSYEYLNLFYARLKTSITAILSFLSGAVLLIFAKQLNIEIHTPLLILSIVGSLILIYDLFFLDKSIQKVQPSLFNILYIIAPIAVLVSLHTEKQFSVLLISSLFLIWISDISAYFVGRTIGKRKLFQKVSPGKTWEGFWGAGLTTVLFSYAFFSYFGIYTVRQWAAIAITIWLFGSLGDLVESKFKRALDIKDSGSIMPGHGGILDRFDAFIFCLPFVVLLTSFF